MSKIRRVEVLKHILESNEQIAASLKALWSKNQTFVVNLLSSPGSGKTTLLEATLPHLKDRYRVAVLEGDLETERDAERIHALGIETVQITTGGTCHLEAHMVKQGWEVLNDKDRMDFLFVENVGNLVCPASFDLGEHLRVVLLSVPEGDDKPAKYPVAFRSAQALVITKIDLLPYFDFDLDRVKEEALAIQPNLQIFEVSAKTGEGIRDWVAYLEAVRARLFDRPSP